MTTLLAMVLAVTLSWTDNSANEEGFRIYRSDGVGGAYVAVGSTATDVATFVDSAGQVGHCWRVTAFNAAGESQPSNSVCLMMVVPTGPGGLGAQITP